MINVADDVTNKFYVDRKRYTAVWGGQLARIGASGRWYAIPTGHQPASFTLGTGGTPDTAFTLSSTADDLVPCIWASMHDITVTGCKIWYGEGGTNSTTHSVYLMRYEIDADGDLDNGTIVANTGSLASDNSSMARALTLSLSGTAANLDIDFSNNEILIACINPIDSYNSNLSCKVILEYTEVET